MEQALAAAEAFEQPIARTARQERNARYYQNRKERLKASEQDDIKAFETIKTVSDACEAGTEIARAPVNPNPSLRSGLLVTPLPSVGPQADVEGEKRKRSSGSSLPADWSPPDELFTYGETLGLTRDQSAEIIERMRLWAHGNKNRAVARKADWIATMQGALRRDAPRFKARAGPTQRPEKPYNPTYGELLDALRNQPHDDETSGCDGASSCADAGDRGFAGGPSLELRADAGREAKGDFGEPMGDAGDFAARVARQAQRD